MRLHHVLDDGQAEPETSVARRPRTIDAIEALEHRLELSRGNALAVVLDLDHRLAVLGAAAHLDPPTRTVVLDGVVHQVSEHPVQAATVAPALEVVLASRTDIHLSRLGLGLKVADHLPNHPAPAPTSSCSSTWPASIDASS